MRSFIPVIAFLAASLGLWNGRVERSDQASAEAIPASFTLAPTSASHSLQVEAGTPLRVRLSPESIRSLRAGMPWAGRTAGPVVMLRADALPPGTLAAGRGRVVFEEVTIPARAPVFGVITSARAMPSQGTLLNVRVRTRDARGRAVALLATGGSLGAGPGPEMRFTVREIVELD